MHCLQITIVKCQICRNRKDPKCNGLIVHNTAAKTMENVFITITYVTANRTVETAKTRSYAVIPLLTPIIQPSLNYNQIIMKPSFFRKRNNKTHYLLLFYFILWLIKFENQRLRIRNEVLKFILQCLVTCVVYVLCIAKTVWVRKLYLTRLFFL